MYKIFYEQRALIFPNIVEKELILDATSQQLETYEVEKIHNFFRQWLVAPLQEDVVIDGISPELLSAALCRTFVMAPAAGGVVIDENRIAAIERNGIPDLPKGHVEEGEDTATAALREVEEETGLKELSILRPLPSSWHCYLYENEWRLKQTSWFLMATADSSQIEPQRDEGISEVVFLGPEDLDWFLENTFCSLADTLGSFLHQQLNKNDNFNVNNKFNNA